MEKLRKRKSNRDTVLQVAAHLFLTKGYQLTSMDEIVDHSKVSKTNIYYHFKSKEDLLLQIMSQFMIHYQERIDTVLARTDLSVIDKLGSFINVIAEDNTGTDYLAGCPFITFYTQVSNDLIKVQEMVKDFFEHQTTLLEQLLSEAIQNKELPEQTPIKQTAALIISSIEGGLFLTKATNNPLLLNNILTSVAFLLKK
ncbi:TetR/AcrR family transcriptional regulator [Paenibacillus solani]|uniref:HTH tetR-type domain-containing protein n=1 Tax=Paenibacillus solani TaxID=1705565 RepID=A0A0M1P661_9BACL|nr:TetR/AcrR family transcriptional regulator [Paenibacillus solani]KOR89529.1 hypothetical protein AM231_10510 [Paenibacillus solani]